LKLLALPLFARGLGEIGDAKEFSAGVSGIAREENLLAAQVLYISGVAHAFKLRRFTNRDVFGPAHAIPSGTL
jgi:hypothetical protein